MGFAVGAPLDASPRVGARLRRRPLSPRRGLRRRSHVARHGVSRVAERATVRALRLRPVGDRRSHPTSCDSLGACQRPRPHRSLERPAGRPRRLPSPGWCRRLDPQLVATLRGRFCRAPAAALPDRLPARARGGGLMSAILQGNRIRCDGHGLCAELLPELISLDDWGYPIVKKGPVPDHLAELARRTVDDCPVLALRLARSRFAAAHPTMPAL